MAAIALKRLVVGLRMPGVFMVPTVWLRTGLTRRWTVLLTYVLALVFLVMINLSLWVQSGPSDVGSPHQRPDPEEKNLACRGR